jgi:hypothetical protein
VLKSFIRDFTGLFQVYRFKDLFTNYKKRKSIYSANFTPVIFRLFHARYDPIDFVYRNEVFVNKRLWLFLPHG